VIETRKGSASVAKQCTTWCLNLLPVAYAISEEKAPEQNLIRRFSKVQAKKSPTASDQSVRVKKLSAEARVPTKGSAGAAGHDLYANKGSDVPAKGQAIFGTGIAMKLYHNTRG